MCCCEQQRTHRSMGSGEDTNCCKSGELSMALCSELISNQLSVWGDETGLCVSDSMTLHRVKPCKEFRCGPRRILPLWRSNKRTEIKQNYCASTVVASGMHPLNMLEMSIYSLDRGALSILQREGGVIAHLVRESQSLPQHFAVLQSISPLCIT